MKQMTLFSPSSDKPESVPPVHTPTTTGDTWTLYIDGASRNNPGPSAAGIYLLKNGKVAEKKGFFLGLKTNNQAEYLALLLGMLVLQKQVKANDSVSIVSDSELMVKQLKGEYKVRMPSLKPLFALAHAMLYMLKGTVKHVLRHHNKEADKMANYGLDNKVSVPPEFIEALRKHEILL
jgi:ribonuclease HI